MHPRIAELRTHLDTTRRQLVETVAGLSPRALAAEPGAGRWTPAQVVEHLAIAEERITQRLMQLVAQVRAAGAGDDLEGSSVFATMPIERALDRSTRLEAAPVLRPADAPAIDAALERLKMARGALLTVLDEADGLRLADASAPHPAFGSLTAYQWVAFLSLHEARHTEQIREIDTLER